MSKSWLAQGLVLVGARDIWMIGVSIVAPDPDQPGPVATTLARSARCRLLYHNIRMEMARLSTDRRGLSSRNFLYIRVDMFSIRTPRFNLRPCMVFTASERSDSIFNQRLQAPYTLNQIPRQDFPSFGGLRRLLDYLRLDSFSAHWIRRIFWSAYRKDLRSAKALINCVAACLLARFGIQRGSVQEALDGDDDIHLLLDLECSLYDFRDMGASLMTKVRRELEDHCYYAVKSFVWSEMSADRTVGLKVVIDRETVLEGWQ